MTMWFADRAGVNVGVITCIWSINPLFMGLLDFLIFGQELKYYHIVGMAALILSVVSISFVGNYYSFYYKIIKNIQESHVDSANG